MTPCISEAATMPASFAEDVEAFAGAGWPAMEVWLTKLEQHLKEHSAEHTRALLASRGIAPAAASYQGGLLLTRGEARQAHVDHFKRRLVICQEFGIPVMLIAADFGPKVGGAEIDEAIRSLRQAARWAAAFDVRLALEFRGGDAFCTCLDTALTLVEQCGQPNVGVNLDVFHYYKGPSKSEDLRRLTRGNLAFVQLCDVAGLPRELASDADRILPGEGDFDLKPILDRLREIGYAGHVSLELFNPVLWQNKPSQLAELGLAAMNRMVSAA